MWRRLAAAVLMAGLINGAVPATSAPAAAGVSPPSTACALSAMGIPDCDQAREDCAGGGDCTAYKCCLLGLCEGGGFAAFRVRQPI